MAGKPILFMVQDSQAGPRLVEAQKVGRSSYESVKERDSGKQVVDLANGKAETLTLLVPKDFRGTDYDDIKKGKKVPTVQIKLGKEDNITYDFQAHIPNGVFSDNYFLSYGKDRQGNSIHRYTIRGTHIYLNKPGELKEKDTKTKDN